MSDDGTDDPSDSNDGPESDERNESNEEAGPGEEIPISTGDDRADEDETAADSTDKGVEIDVETGSPGPDAKRRSDDGDGSEGGPDFGGSETGPLGQFDETVVSLLSRVLGAETHVRVYAGLRRRPWSTPEALAEVTGLYPRTVRDALAVLESYGVVTRREPVGRGDEQRASETTADRNPEPEYAAIAPGTVMTDLIGGGGQGLSEQLSTDRSRPAEAESAADENGPVRIDIGDDPDGSGAAGEDDERASDENDSDTATEADEGNGDGADE